MLKLNPEQRVAREHGEGPLLVVAGPGTGKTRVITERIIYLMNPVPARPAAQSLRAADRRALLPTNILALTFTDKAAAEMKRRVAEALPGLNPLPTISTFHAFCYQTLRQHQIDRRLLDKVDVWIFLRRRMAELGLKFYQKLAEPGAFLHDLNEFFSRCQDELIEPQDFERYAEECRQEFIRCYPPPVAGAADGRSTSPEADWEWEEILKKLELARVFSASRRLLEDAGASSLGSLVSETVGLWQRRPDVLSEARARYRAVLVDEFQDTNYGQLELLKLLVTAPYDITAVGDDDQAIYRFRGASHGAFEMFGKAFPGHRTVYLAQNYRSTRTILRVASAVIARNDRYARKPPLASSHGEGCKVFLLRAHEAASEACWIAEEIQRLQAEGVSWGQIAILYRAHHYRDLVVKEFRQRAIPFAIRGLSILSAPLLRDFVAWLRLIHSRRDNISLTRVLLAPRWRFPETLAQAIRLVASKEHCSLHEVLQRPPAEVAREIEATAWAELEVLRRKLARVSRSLTVTELANRLVDRMGWHYLPGSRNQAYLEAFGEFLNQWERKSEMRKLSEFIEYLDWFAEAGGKVEAPELDGGTDAVQMMTIHAAKGLEFPAVFLIGVSPRRFPATTRKAVIEFPPELRKGPPAPPDIHLQEERRLFFVAITRAQERLYISSVSKSARQQSLFISELLSSPAIVGRDLEIIDVPDSPRSGTRHLTPGTFDASEVPPAVWHGQGTLFDDDTTREAASQASLAQLAGSVVVPRAEKLDLSATAVGDYLDCPLKYKFQHQLKIPTAPQAALTFGSIMHQSVRHYFELRRTGRPAFKDIEDFYLRKWKSVGFEDAYHEETYRSAGLEQLRIFVEHHNALEIGCQRVGTEQAFHLDLGDITLQGRIDQINLLDGSARAAELIDYKTGRPRTEKDAQKSLQLSVYALGASKALDLVPERLTFYNLTNNEAISVTKTPEELRETLQKVRDVSAKIRSGQFEPTPGFVCRSCNFVPLCPAHEDG
jgi:DNA helicase II / ATP-dependent DNA helicase PcrA